MNYFKIGADQYKVEIRAEGTHFIVALCLLCDGGRWAQRSFRGFWAPSRPAARRALKREIERLATGPDGKRANWTIVRREPVVRIRFDTSKATASLRKVSRALSLLGGAAAYAGAAFDDFGRAYRSPEVAR